MHPGARLSVCGRIVDVRSRTVSCEIQLLLDNFTGALKVQISDFDTYRRRTIRLSVSEKGRCYG
jgi:hypothetical protein